MTTEKAFASVRTMNHDDIPAADVLREIAGWNQSIDDWHRLRSWEPDLCLVADLDGRVVGTLTATRNGDHWAWIGMVLVHPDVRRRGVARALLAEALTRLKQRGIPMLGLDATPMGRRLYESAGFQPVEGLLRYEGNPSRPIDSRGVRSFEFQDLHALIALDEAASGARRPAIIEGLATAVGGVCSVIERDGDMVGFACRRAGAHRWYVGPIVAPDISATETLLGAMIADVGGREVVLDVFDSDRAMVELCEGFGLRRVRPFIRMVMGAVGIEHHPSYRAIAGPEVG